VAMFLVMDIQAVVFRGITLPTLFAILGYLHMELFPMDYTILLIYNASYRQNESVET